MKKVLVLLSTLSLLLSILITPIDHTTAASKHTELLISAAASLQDSLEEVAKQYEKEHPEIKLTFNYGSSGTLQKQIEQGASADLFFSAGQKQMDALTKQDLITTSKTVLRNDLVLVIPADSKQTFTGVKQLTDASIKKIAIGQPESVPAGQYAKETLTARQLWDTLQGKLVYAKDVRQVLTYVETGNVEAGFVYKTDALTSKKVKIAINVSPDVHTPIVYPVGVIKDTKHNAEATAFYTYLQSKAASSVFTKYGFKQP
jgi:molybdate transport system substrate-binding protein